MTATERSPEPAEPRAPGAGSSMHNRFDQLSKSILRDALGCVAASDTEVEVLAATQRIDVYAVPDPARAAAREKMGLLGELSLEPSLFETFRNTPNVGRTRRVLCKQLTWHHELERRAHRAARTMDRAVPGALGEPAEDEAQPLVPFPWLVVISPGRPTTVLDVYGCKRCRPGVYDAVAGLQMRVAVLAELPRTRDTLLLRLLGTGRLLAEALADLEALPEDAWEKSIATPILLHFGLETGGKRRASEEDGNVSAEIRAWAEGYEQRIRAKERAGDVLTVLRVRGIAVPVAAHERILVENDPVRLERWLEKAVVAASVADVIDG